MRGEKIHEHDLDMTGISDHGHTRTDAPTGAVAIQPQSTRRDVELTRTTTAQLSTTTSLGYGWLNNRQLWGVGIVTVAEGEVLSDGWVQ